MGYLSEVELLESFLFEKDGALGRLTFASAALEILYDLLAEDEPHPDLYDLTLQFFRLIDTGSKGGLISLFLAYFMKTLSYLGYRPNFSGCVSCGKDRESSAIAGNNGQNQESTKFYFFTPERGGLICSACQKMGEYYIKLQFERLEMIYRLQTSSLAEAGRLRHGFNEAEEIIELLTDFMRFQTGTKELNSIKFLEKLRKAKL